MTASHAVDDRWYVAADGLRVDAYDTATGDRLWTYEIDTYGHVTSLLADSEMLYVGTFDARDGGGAGVVVLAQDDGARVWERKLSMGLQGTRLGFSHDLSLLIALVEARDRVGIWSEVIAMAPSDGDPAWTTRLEGHPEGLHVVDERIHFTLSTDGRTSQLITLRMQDGQDVQRVALPTIRTTYLASRGDTIFAAGEIASRSVVVAVDAETGSIRWERRQEPAVDREGTSSDLLLADQGPLVLAWVEHGAMHEIGRRIDAGRGAEALALDPLTGVELWAVRHDDQTTALTHPSAASLVLSPDGAIVYFASATRFDEMDLDAIVVTAKVRLPSP